MPPFKLMLGGSAIASYLVNSFAPQYAIWQSYFLTGSAIFIGLALAWGIWEVLLYPQYFSPLRDLPTPPGASFLGGHAGKIIRESTGLPMLEWTNSVPNDGLIRYFQWLNRERLLVTSPKALAEVLVTKNYEFIKPNLIRQGLGRLLGVGILLAEGDEHRKQRRNLSPAFAFRHVKDLYPVFWAKAVELVDRIGTDNQARPTDYEHESNVINVGDYTSRVTLDIIGTAGMGHDFGSLADPSNELYQTYKRVFSPPRFFRILQLFSLVIPPVIMQNIPLKRNFEIRDARTLIRKTCRDLIAGKRAAMEKAERTEVDILSVALESGGFTDEDLVDQMMTFLAAGHETTSTALLWSVFLLCKHPDVQRRLRDEIHAHLASPRKPDGRTVNSIQIDSLPYLAAVCNEVLRLWAPVSLTMRVAAQDTSIVGHPVPKGTLVIMSPWATNNSYELWGADALEFNPDRWMRDGQANKGGAESNYSFLSFLHGPRSCIGEKFARAEYACLLAALVGRFEMEFEKGEFEPEIVGGITSKPKGGLWVRTKETGW